MAGSLTLAELSDVTGVPARTIRFYIARGILPAPAKAGRGASYTPEHVERIEHIRRLQAEGRTLSEIGALQDAPAGLPEPSAWWQHAICEDVSVLVKGDVSPWRMRHIRAAIREFAARVRSSDEKEIQER